LGTANPNTALYTAPASMPPKSPVTIRATIPPDRVTGDSSHNTGDGTSGPDATITLQPQNSVPTISPAGPLNCFANTAPVVFTASAPVQTPGVTLTWSLSGGGAITNASLPNPCPTTTTCNRVTTRT